MRTTFVSGSLAVLTAFGLSFEPARAVMFDATGDPTFNTTAPGGALAGSGWQYQGTFNEFLGTPISSRHFITAAHIGGAIGDTFTINGISYTTVGFSDDPNSDLRIWQVDTEFDSSVIAPLYTGSDEAGKALTVFGRGTQRGSAVNNPELQGWSWGTPDQVQRWGTNTVDGVADRGAGLGDMLVADFDHIGGTEAMLSLGDSGGAVFIQDGGVWKLAGINYAVSGPYYINSAGDSGFNAALFDESGFYESAGDGVFLPADGPGYFLSTRISSNLAFINSVVPEPGTSWLVLSGLALLIGRSRLRSRR